MHSRTLSYCLLVLCLVGAATRAEEERGKSLAEIVRDLAPGQSFTTKEGLTIKKYQKDAGVPDADGWYLARSMKGGFSVRFPAKFSDGTSVAKTEDGAVATVYTLGTTAKDGTRFLINCFERSDSKVPDGALAKAIKGFEGRSLRFTWQPFSRDVISGLEFRGVYENGVDFAGRAFVAQQRLCEFIVEFASTRWAEIPAVVRTSLDSFQSTRSNPTAR